MAAIGDRGSKQRLHVRDAQAADMAEIQRIYATHALTSLATFEEAAPSVDEMAARRARIVDLGLPYLVAEEDGGVLGFSYAAPYRSRSAYRYTLEDSVYVAPEHGGRGIGTALLGSLISRCEQGPWRQLIAVIGDSGNFASISLHKKLGFHMVGALTGVGFKLGRWVDTPIMQRSLGEGAGGPPSLTF